MNRLLKTGQTTVYATGDNGTNQAGDEKSYTVLNTGRYAGTVNITINAKTDAHSNNCVQDNRTGLMWSSTASASVGPSSNGTLPWTVNGSGEGIFEYAAAANAAQLAGYTDWHIPNITELLSLCVMEAPAGSYNATAFSTLGATQPYSSTTVPNATTQALFMVVAAARADVTAKTNTRAVLLVRGGTP